MATHLRGNANVNEGHVCDGCTIYIARSLFDETGAEGFPTCARAEGIVLEV